MIIRNLFRRLARTLRVATVVSASALPAAAILGGGLCFVGSASGVEVLENGSFEDPSPAGWDDGAGVDNDIGFNTYDHVANVYYSGPDIPASFNAGPLYGWAWGVDNGSGEFGSATQLVDVSGNDGAMYSFSAWLAAYFANDDYAIVSLEWFDGAGGTGNSLGGHTFDGSNNAGVVMNADGTGPGGWALDNWSLYAADGTVPNGALSAAVVLAGSAVNNNGNDAYVDLVSLDIIPEPAALGLFGLGGLAILGLRRSRNE